MFLRHPAPLIALVFLLSCGRTEREPEPEKDLVNFTLPPRVVEAAPRMQEHLYRVVHYNSTRFSVKPDMVFLDEVTPTMGQLDTEVTRLNLLHLAYWQGEQLVWSGSLMHPVGRGAHAFSKRGFEVSLRAREGMLVLIFRDEVLTLEHRFPIDTDHEAWLEQGDQRLYMNAYVFPDALINGDPEQRRQEREDLMRRLEERKRQEQGDQEPPEPSKEG